MGKDNIEDREFDKEAIDKSIEDFRRNVTDKGKGNPTRTNHLGNVSDRWNGALCSCNESSGCEICSGDELILTMEDTPVGEELIISMEDDPVGYEVKKTKNMGASANAGMTRDDSTTATRLLDKNWSPLIIRKYQMHGWPMFIGIICDANLNDLDDLVYDVMDKADKDHGFIDGTIQGARNACGFLSDELVKHYNGIKRGVMEGNIVFWYQDKLAISSAYGDLMTHEKCAMEFYSILNMMPHI